jgi:hypothetical protein
MPFQNLSSKLLAAEIIDRNQFDTPSRPFVVYDDQTSTPVQEFTNIDDGHRHVNSLTQ